MSILDGFAFWIGKALAELFVGLAVIGVAAVIAFIVLRRESRGEKGRYR